MTKVSRSWAWQAASPVRTIWQNSGNSWKRAPMPLRKVALMAVRGAAPSATRTLRTLASGVARS